MTLRLLFFITLLTSLLSAHTHKEKLVFEWIIPLKQEQSFNVHREYAGAVVRGNDIVVALRSGELVAVDGKSGRIVFKRKYEGTHTIKPLVDTNNILYLASGSSLRALDSHYDEKWYISLRAPIATSPLIDGDILYISTLDNTVYAINKETGKKLGSYTSYDTVPLSYIRLANPIKVDDKIVFGFANGTIVFFMIKKEGEESINLIPYFRFRTKKSTISSGHRFYDLFTLKAVEDNLLFSNGEFGGKIVAGKTVPINHMENVILIDSLLDDSYIGYGQGGIYSFSHTGDYQKHLFQTDNFVTGIAATGETVLVTTEGHPTFLARKEGGIYLLNKEYTQLFDATIIPGGISSQPIILGNNIIVLTNAGALIKIIIEKSR